MVDIRLTVRENAPFVGLSVGTETQVALTVEEGHGALPPIYDGETTVMPSAHAEQVLPTKNHIVKDDITVIQIPYAEVSNIGGGYTASIAS